MNVSTTICALSTPAGVGAIALIRMSGPDAVSIAQDVFTKNMLDAPGYSVHYGQIVENKEWIDDVVVTVFRAPKSFTGEDSVEIACHGSRYIQQRLLKALLNQGAVLAEPGEFSKRAFYNGKLDLTQTEAIADLIHAESEAAHRVALHQMKGGISAELRILRDELIHFASLVELELDFSEEDVEFADRTQLNDLLNKVIARIQSLLHTFKTGNAIKNGIQVAIVGKPNAGKSSWINALTNDDVAIVSDIAGTTRDKIEVPLLINGQLFRLVDTAGIRHTVDVIEGLGIKKAEEMIQKAAIILYLVDSSTATQEELQTATSYIQSLNNEGKLLFLMNKADLLPTPPAWLSEFSGMLVSAHEPNDVQRVKEALVETAQLNTINEQEVIITNLRHAEALQQALIDLEKTQLGLNSQLSGDFIAMDIRQAIYHLGSITGEITSDDLLGNIFKNFCIGK
jgi:tRNA modification GTPase